MTVGAVDKLLDHVIVLERRAWEAETTLASIRASLEHKAGFDALTVLERKILDAIEPAEPRVGRTIDRLRSAAGAAHRAVSA